MGCLSGYISKKILSDLQTSPNVTFYEEKINDVGHNIEYYCKTSSDKL